MLDPVAVIIGVATRRGVTRACDWHVNKVVRPCDSSGSYACT